MKFKDLNSGYSIPVVGLGTGKLVDPQEIRETIRAAIKSGYRHIDTAYAYNNEICIGKALKEEIDCGNVTRDELFIVTKLPINGMRHDLVSHFVSLSLNNLQLDYIDLYLIHWPVGVKYVKDCELKPRNEDTGELLLDMNINLEEIWKALEEEVKVGKIRSIGLSNFNEGQIQRILNSCTIKPANLQIEMHAYFQQNELREFCAKNDIVVCAYAPLGSQGRRKYINADKLNIPKLFDDAVVKKIASVHEKTAAQVLLRFLTQGLGIVVIPKTANTERLKENIEIFDFDLTLEEITRFRELDEGERARSCPPFDGAIFHPECPFKMKDKL